ncbi:NERD domain-containing protein [Burkholderia vietnamiensis]|uniref:NERD domain-containing protein n=1 Tax=Burkholderia vietnamiensis TaxID=60552 RepID=UPI00075B09E6|nr:NERD domain-containing protein [Burkholderia vietnamiensis]KVR98557.1 hypothetical protein WK28_05715 [Burkholderia vietnamiensis]
MIVHPRYALRPSYLGEMTVLDLLARVPDEHGFAIHSVNLPDHEYKRWGEADFVVVNRSGVTLLEVKGGIVSLTGRVWRYANARGRAIKSTEGPARQAISAAVALEELLGKRLGRKIRCRWGVCFPLSHFTRELAELPAVRLADARTCADAQRFAVWLRDLPFDRHAPSAFALDESEIDAIREIVVPEFSATMSLGLTVRAAQEKVIRLTAQQAVLLEGLVANSRLCISGGAGTGKSELAALTARAETQAGRRPAIVTTAGPFHEALRVRMAAFGIPVVTETLPPGTDTLIVDEGQDFARPREMASLFAQLPGGIAAGRWRWFMDSNLQFRDVPPDVDCLADLAVNAVTVSLTRNVRSTTEIVSTIRGLLDVDTGISDIDGYGIRVGMHRVADAAEEQDRIVSLVTGLLATGILPSDIAVLGPAGKDGTVCADVLRRLPNLFRPLSLAGHLPSGRHGVICSIADFRGLEAQVVIMTDLDMLAGGRKGEAELYTGMSRASASLHLFVSPRFGERLKGLVRQSFERG